MGHRLLTNLPRSSRAAMASSAVSAGRSSMAAAAAASFSRGRNTWPLPMLCISVNSTAASTRAALSGAAPPERAMASAAAKDTPKNSSHSRYGSRRTASDAPSPNRL